MIACGVCGAKVDGRSRFCGECGAPVDAHPVALSSWTVGSGDDVDIRMDHPSVSRRHLEVRPGSTADRLVLRDLGSSNGTYFRALRIAEVEVSVDDTVQLGLLPVPVRRFVRPTTLAPPSARSLVIGRDLEVPARVDLPTVSGRHAELRLGAGGLEVRDLGSKNGTFVDGVRITDWARIPPAARLQLGSYRIPEAQLDAWRRTVSGEDPASAGAVPVALTGTITIGRDPASDVVIDHAAISWHHARIETRSNGKTRIVDLNSTNGVFVDDKRVRSASIGPGARVRLGSVPLEVRPGDLVAPTHFRGEIRLDVADVSRELPNGRVILDNVSLTIFPGELVALMGPSGAGKTTLLEILTGQRTPSSGQVLVNGRDVAHATSPVGYVPQEDVMHRDLTVYEVLYHAARLRLPSDLPAAAVREHVERLLDRMGLAHVRDTLIGGEHVRGISGGQRKRVNIAIELITEPPLLFLDEPTSGLDATSTLEVLQVLHSLASDGKTIVMTIHQPRVEAFQLFDMVVLLAKGGKLAYYGPAIPDVLHYFRRRSKVPAGPQTNPADYALDALDPPNAEHFRSPADWQRDYRSSEEHQTYVAARSAPSAAPPAGPPSRSVPSGAAQAVTLLLRLGLRKLRDRTALALQVLQPSVVGLLLWSIFSDIEWPFRVDGEVVEAMTDHLRTQQLANKAHVVVFLVAATTFWLGCSNVARELVAERPVFWRERMAGLSVGAYVAAHFLVQVAVGIAQVVILIALGWAPILDASPLQAGLLAWVALASGVGVGMLVSSLVRTEVTAISTLPLLLLPQLLLAGYLQTFEDMGEGLQWLAMGMPVQWAFQALLSAEYAAAQPHFDNIEEVFGFPSWSTPVAPAVLGGFVVLTLTATFVRLRTQSSGG